MKSTEEIFLEMKNDLESRSGTVVHEGGDMYLRLYAVATEIASLWAQVDWAKNQSFPQTASGEYLERHAFARGLARGGSSKASGIIRFEVDESSENPILVSSGTVCQTANGVEFITKDDAEIYPGKLFCETRALAREAGQSGNVKAGTIRFMTIAPLGVKRCTNLEDFSGGEDVEDDESLRNRILVSFATLPNGSNRAYYETTALNTEGVGAASAISRPRGVGSVDVIVASDDGVPSRELVAKVDSKLSKEREICVDLKVLAPKRVSVDVKVAIEIEDGDRYEVVKANTQKALDNHFDGKLLGKNVLLAQIGNVVFQVPGVSNYKILSPSQDVEISKNELPVAGNISVVRR